MTLTRIILAVLLLFLASAPRVWAGSCPDGVDPTYCAAAEATGGKVYTGTAEDTGRQLLANLEKEQRHEIRRQHWEESLYLLIRGFWFALAFCPLFLPLAGYFFLRKRPLPRFTFSCLYGLACATPAAGICLGFIIQGIGNGFPSTYAGISLFFLAVGVMVGHIARHRKRLLIFGAAFAGLLSYASVVLLMILSSIH